MPSSKTTGKTRQKEEKAPVAEAVKQQEQASPARTSRSVKAKVETLDSTSAKRHRKPAATGTEAAAATSSVVAPKAMSAAAGVGQGSIISPAVDPVADVLATEITSAHIAELAHSYFAARGHEHGSAEEDWLRAERELGKTRR